MAINEQQRNDLLDATMQEGSGYDIDPRDTAFKLKVSQDGNPKELTIDHMPFRSIANMKKIYALFDKQLDLDCAPANASADDTMNALETIVDNYLAHGVSSLPQAIRPIQVPQNCIFQLMLSPAGPGKYHAISQFYFTGGIATTQISPYIKGEAFVPIFREGGWTFKKAVQMILDRVPGVHIKRYAISPKVRANDGGNGSSTKSWTPSPEELNEGAQFINNHVETLDESNNELYVFLLAQIRTPGSKIYQWPISVVEKMTKNKRAPMEGATREFFFPYLSDDCIDVFKNEVLPLILPWTRENGILIGGWPGLGKTPMAKMLARLMGRYWAEVRGLEGKQGGWRQRK